MAADFVELHQSGMFMRVDNHLREMVSNNGSILVLYIHTHLPATIQSCLRDAGTIEQ